MIHALSETNLVSSICRESFYAFLREFWDVVIPEKPVWNWHIQFLCDELQVVAERVFRDQPKKYDLIINVPPGTTKSTIASIAFPIWTWVRMPTARHICGSHAFDLGMDLSRKSRDLVLEQSRHDGKASFHDCFPEIVLRDDQNTKGYFANTLGGMRKSVTVGGKSPVGFHAHFLIIDDPIDPQKAVSEAEIKNANDWMTESLPSRKVDKRITPTILIMQRLHQNDPSGNRLVRKQAGKIKHICLPADAREYEVHPPELLSYYDDDLLDPVRLPRSVLRESRSILGEFGYSGQFGQSPVPLGGGMFKVDRMKIDSPSVPHLHRVHRFWDKAATPGGGAFTVGVKMGMDKRDSRIWVLDVVRGQWDSDERERVIVQMAELDGREVIIGLEQEPGSGGKESAQATVRRLMGYRVKIDRPTGDKALRADPYSCQVNEGNVSLVKGEWNRDYIEELRYFPASTYKDQVDASSGAFNLMATTRRRVGPLFRGGVKCGNMR